MVPLCSPQLRQSLKLLRVTFHDLLQGLKTRGHRLVALRSEILVVPKGRYLLDCDMLSLRPSIIERRNAEQQCLALEIGLIELVP